MIMSATDAHVHLTCALIASGVAPLLAVERAEILARYLTGAGFKSDLEAREWLASQGDRLGEARPEGTCAGGSARPA
jgi:hypothetical protein